MMRLSVLAKDLPIRGSADPDVAGVSEDSRRIERGMVFVAVPGTSVDGQGYVADAIARGAVAIVAEHDAGVPPAIPFVRTESARRALATMAARFYSQPAADLDSVGFTGTFGKTSTSEVLRALLEAGGRRTGVLGSLGARYAGFHDPGNGLTTPAPVELHRALRGLRDAGADTVILEVTSHALRMHRVDGLTLAGGLIAAIMPGEHTDFHRSYEDYVAAKRIFLDYLAADAVLAFDADNRAAAALAAEARVGTRAGVSLEGRGRALQLRDVVLNETGARFTIDGHSMHSALLGRGHLRNVALALAYALASGVALPDADAILRTLSPLRRRMETYAAGGRLVLDDTAAHPDSFRATFEVAALVAGARDCRVVVAYAVRGNRGAAINQVNARALADLAAVHRVDTLIVTGASDAVGPVDRASALEIDAAREALAERGRRFVWRDTLRDAMHDAGDATRAGDLIVLVGAQGMNEGRPRLLEALGP